MAKKLCAVCERKLGILSRKIQISDAVICMNCLNSAGISTLSNPMAYSQQSIANLINTRKIIVQKFKPTKFVGNYISIDENNKLFQIGQDIFTYENLLSFELLEDNQTVFKGGLGRAIAGGLFFGGIGAIIGGITGKRREKNICHTMRLRVSLKNTYTDVVYINLITTRTKIRSFVYKSATNSAQQCITLLETISNYTNCTDQTTSVADEIMKFKRLLDQKIITQEEFDIKKQELLKL